MQRKINNTVICLRMGKNLTAKTLPGDFQVTTPETPLLSQQAVQARNLKYLTNLQLNPYPNTQSDLFCSDSSPFWCTASKYVTNQLRGSQYATSITNLKRLLSVKIRKMLGHKTLRWKYIATSPRKRWTRSRTLSPVTIFLNRVCSMLV